jgi:NitT/TauT family transport system substrate-binding protein
MMNRITLGVAAAALLASAPAWTPSPSFAAPKKEFTMAWTVYVGWMPWPYAADAGIVKKWADKYHIKINVIQINDYVESLNQFTAGKIDAVTAANMDALTVPAAGGVDTSAIIIGDFSNGNDGIVVKKGDGVASLKGQKINLVELSVSHYLLARALNSAGLKEADVTTVNTSDSDIVGAFKAADTTAVVTWNPQLTEIKGSPDAREIFDSSKIPGEIIDTTIVRGDVLADNPDFAKALAGIWYETISLMAKQDEAGKTARTAMAKLSGSDLAGFDGQLKTTRMFYDPKEGVAFTSSADLVKTMDMVRTFSFAHGLLGEGAKTADAVGMTFPGGKTLGDAKNLKLHFDPSFMALAAEGKL